LVVLWNPAVSEIFNGECDAMVDMTLIRLLNKSRSFIFVPINFSYATSYRLSIAIFSLGLTVLATIHNVTDDNDRQRQTDATL